MPKKLNTNKEDFLLMSYWFTFITTIFISNVDWNFPLLSIRLSLNSIIVIAQTSHRRKQDLCMGNVFVNTMSLAIDQLQHLIN